MCGVCAHECGAQCVCGVSGKYVVYVCVVYICVCCERVCVMCVCGISVV